MFLTQKHTFGKMHDLGLSSFYFPVSDKRPCIEFVNGECSMLYATKALYERNVLYNTKLFLHLASKYSTVI